MPESFFRTESMAFSLRCMMVRNRADDRLYMVEDSNVFLTDDHQEVVLLHRFCRLEIRGFFSLSDLDPLSPDKQAYYLAHPFPVWRRKS